MYIDFHAMYKKPVFDYIPFVVYRNSGATSHRTQLFLFVLSQEQIVEQLGKVGSNLTALPELVRAQGYNCEHTIFGSLQASYFGVFVEYVNHSVYTTHSACMLPWREQP